MKHDITQYHRRSIRLRGYDYSQNGGYFVTVCVENRECILGEVMTGKVLLNDAGRTVEEWFRTPAVRPHVDVDEFVVMPNHFQGIVAIRNRPSIVRAIRRVAPTAKGRW